MEEAPPWTAQEVVLLNEQKRQLVAQTAALKEELCAAESRAQAAVTRAADATAAMALVAG